MAGDEEVGPLRRVLSSCFLCIVGCLLFPLALYLLFQGEVAYVCKDVSIDFANEQVDDNTAIDCSTPPSNTQNVFLNCAINSDSLDSFDWKLNKVVDKSEKPFIKEVASVERNVEIFACKKVKKKVPEGEGKNKRYVEKTEEKMDWMTEVPEDQCNKKKVEDSLKNKFKEARLVQKADRQSITKATAGNGQWNIPMQDVKQVGFETATLGSAPDGYRVDGNTLKSKLRCFEDDEVNRIGCIRITYKTWQPTRVAAIGKYEGGTLKEFVREKRFPQLCSRVAYMQVMAGGDDIADRFKTKAQFIATVKSDEYAGLIAGRVGFLVLAWLAVFCILSPISAIAGVVTGCIGMIPFIGGCIENAVDTLVTVLLCCVSATIGCLSGSICILIGYAYIHPQMWWLVALVIAILIAIGIMMGKAHRNRAAEAETKSARQPELSAEIMATRSEVPFGAQMAAQGGACRVFQVVCPANTQGGAMVQVQTPDGQMVQVQVPLGVYPGQVFNAQY